MKKLRYLLWASVIGVFMLVMSAYAKPVVYDEYNYDELPGDRFGETNYVYYRIHSEKDTFTMFGCYGFNDDAGTERNEYVESREKYRDNVLNLSSGDYTARLFNNKGKKSWSYRYSYVLCDKNKKVIDPAGIHKPGKANYTYRYYLKKGDYYLRISTNRRKCGTCLINYFWGRERGEPEDPSETEEPGSSKKKKAPKLTVWNKNNYWDKDISCPLYSSGKNFSQWYKFHADGKKPVYIHVNIGYLTGKWDFVIYEPSSPKGRAYHIPEAMKITDEGYAKIFYKGKKALNENVFTIYRKKGSKILGPVPGWYYIQIKKSNVSGKKDNYYQKMGIYGSLYVSVVA